MKQAKVVVKSLAPRLRPYNQCQVRHRESKVGLIVLKAWVQQLILIGNKREQLKMLMKRNMSLIVYLKVKNAVAL